MSRLLTSLSLIVILIVGIFILRARLIIRETESVVSPLPSFLTALDNNQVTTLNLWIPEIISQLFASDQKIPGLTSKSVLVYDLQNGKTLFAKNADEKLPIASLTKIMTAVIALEHQKSDNRYMAEQSDLVGENSMGLTGGEVLTLKDLLYGLMLVSGNDAAEVLAHNYQGGRDAFVWAMNKKAESLGLKNTHFSNPSGLQGDGEQYSTASDLLIITNYALSHFPLFGEVVATFEHDISYSKDHKEFYLQNETNLISSYPGVKGVKDGYTPEAGLCLVTYLDYQGHKIIGIILGSENRRGEMKDLLDYSLKTLGSNSPKHS